MSATRSRRVRSTRPTCAGCCPQRAQPDADVVGLAAVLAAGNPAPYAGVVRLPSHDVSVATASPELFLRRDGDRVMLRPDQRHGAYAGGSRREGPGRERDDHRPGAQRPRGGGGDRLRRRARSSAPSRRTRGSCTSSPRVTARLRPEVGWADLLAVDVPARLGQRRTQVECAAHHPARSSRSPAVPTAARSGWVDADRRQAVLAVGIRTFWLAGGALHFGTGAGITWGSDPAREWEETELKARHLRRPRGRLADAAGGPPHGRAPSSGRIVP